MEKQITVKLLYRPVKYTDKKTGAEKSFDALCIEFTDGKTLDIKSDRYNYRTVDYLTELLGGK